MSQLNVKPNFSTIGLKTWKKSINCYFTTNTHWFNKYLIKKIALHRDSNEELHTDKEWHKNVLAKFSGDADATDPGTLWNQWSKKCYKDRCAGIIIMTIQWDPFWWATALNVMDMVLFSAQSGYGQTIPEYTIWKIKMVVQNRTHCKLWNTYWYQVARVTK